MKYYVIAGEASGDLHASNLIRALFAKDPSAKVRAWGGELSAKAGAEVIKDYKDLSFMGFVEVLTHLKTIFSNLDFCVKDILFYKPDVVILVDYPGFNLRIAKRLYNKGIPVCYYISPQVWAWKKSRIVQIGKYISEMYVILPFEKDFYFKHGLNVHYLGHPLMDEICLYRPQENFLKINGIESEHLISLLPGSRTQEIRRILPVMLEAAKFLPNYDFVIAGVSNQSELYEHYVKNSRIKVIYGHTYDLLANSEFAMVTSGTATLETALLNVPQVVCYKGNVFSYFLAKHLIKGIEFISLVNLIAGKKVVAELIQSEMNVKNLLVETKKIIENRQKEMEIKSDYENIRKNLGDGHASERVAESVLSFLKKSRNGEYQKKNNNF